MSTAIRKPGAAACLSFAAAPTFAIMALMTGIFAERPPDMLCSAAHGVPSLCGMTPMYLLMSAFHAAPWLKLISARRGPPCRSSRMHLYHLR